MPLQATSGAASYDAFGGGVPVVPAYIEQIFSTYLYTGNNSTQTINNGIDLSTKGGLVWTKNRENYPNYLIDTVQTKNKILVSNSTNAAITAFDSSSYGLTSFNTNGYTLGPDFTESLNTSSTRTFVSWTFRKQPKFFDIQTWTGNGTIGRTISHSLGSVPGCIIVKRTNGVGDWVVYHRSLGATKAMLLNLTDSVYTWNVWNDTAPTSTVFSLNDASEVNGAGNTYVAYVLAHDAGGFGLTGTDNVISCGSYTGNGSTNGPTVTLGYEPQWILVKNASGANPWNMDDNMRGWEAGGLVQNLQANASYAESQQGPALALNSTGFKVVSNDSDWNGTSATYIYIAIRRGPMKVPTSGTSVFAPLTYTGNGTSGRYISGAGFPPDLIIQTARSASENREFDDRLRGGGSTAMNALFSNSTNAEAADSGSVQLLNQDGFTVRSFGNGSSVTYIGECFRRAPSFFDEVCYTGTGVAGRTVTHNLTVVPELMIVKGRSNAGQWRVYSSALGATQAARLNSTDSFGSNPYAWNDTAPTASVFTVGDDTGVNENTYTYVAYLFATCAGVSKCGSYTGNGSTQTINCGFTGGARFVMVKATSTTGNWIVADSARGIVAGNDPALYLNSTTAEVTGLDWIDADNSGFVVNETATIAANTNGVSYIFLAIA